MLAQLTPSPQPAPNPPPNNASEAQEIVAFLDAFNGEWSDWSSTAVKLKESGGLDDDPDGGGCALVSDAATVAIYRSSFVANRAQRNGGALYMAGGRLTLDDVQVRDNFAAERGGGAYVARGVLLLTNGAVLEGNEVQRYTCDVAGVHRRRE